jgi:hypothetical protein
VLELEPNGLRIGKFRLKSSHKKPSNKIYNVKSRTGCSLKKKQLANTDFKLLGHG